jgi:demethylmenaquinone methyltransferase/2-methoxy-6-polyprenyl-1,4-benzoquinol methylase
LVPKRVAAPEPSRPAPRETSVVPASASSDPTDELLAVQRAYYDLRAPDYMNPGAPTDRRSRGLLDSEVVRRTIAGFAPSGDVLELACGSGAFTRVLTEHATSLTCVDGSPQMLTLNREIVGDPNITYIEADLFSWSPPRRFDHLFFGFWLSHVPPSRFDQFWDLVDRCLGPGGRACFVDEDERGIVNEADHDPGDIPTAQRKLGDGRSFTIVKVFWNPTELEARLADIGWTATVRPLAETCLAGTAIRR